MPLLCFPSLDSIRLVLTMGIVPPALARDSIRFALDGQGHPWVEVPAEFPRDVLAALTRIGVLIQGPGTGPNLTPVMCWAETVPLRPTQFSPSGPVLIVLPDQRIATLAQSWSRWQHESISVRFYPSQSVGVLVPHLPLDLLLAWQDDPGLELFVEQEPRAWVSLGWQHPLSGLAPEDQSTILIRPTGPWQIIPASDSVSERPRYSISRRPIPTSPSRPDIVPVRIGLIQEAHPKPTDDLWVLEPCSPQTLANWLGELEPADWDAIQWATVQSHAGECRTLLRWRTPAEWSFPSSFVGRRYIRLPQVPNVYIPWATRLIPDCRPRVFAQFLALDATQLKWLDPDTEGSWWIGSVRLTAFRPISKQLEFSRHNRAVLVPTEPRSRWTQLPHFVVESEPVASLNGTPTANPPGPVPGATPTTTSTWFERLRNRLFRKSPKTVPPGTRSTSVPSTRLQVVPARVEEKLSSHHSLLLGNDWATRRLFLEQRIRTESSTLSTADQSTLWSNLAEIYAAMGLYQDAALCWIDRIWDHMDPTSLQNWLRTEAKLARVSIDSLDAASLVQQNHGRLTAAFLTWASHHPQNCPNLSTWLPALAFQLDQHETQIPIRAVWMARVALDQMTAGDTLGLATSRDRLLARLQSFGPRLSLDAPSFLRFGCRPDGDRYPAAIEWLTRVRDPIQRWLEQHSWGGRMQWVGLDAEVLCTGAYADLMLAWALARLGDRSDSEQLEHSARSTLAQAQGPGVDLGVHRVLALAFASRIQSARDGRPDRPGFPLDAAAELAQIDELGRYAVEKFRMLSSVLEPIARVNPYRGRDLGTLLGSDRLGERLKQLLTRSDLVPEPPIVEELLTTIRTDPTAATLPRVVYTLLELSPYLTRTLFESVLPSVCRALELIPEWFRLAGQNMQAIAGTKRLGARILTSSMHGLVLFQGVESGRQLLKSLQQSLSTPGSPLATILDATMGPFCLALQSLGLGSEARELVTQLARAKPESTEDLGLAMGWYLIGEEDQGNRILNAARDRLFVDGVTDSRERTALALAYAGAVGFAPYRVALGRFEELFLRLDPLRVQGATNRYYTAKPLELIDIVVRAVVGENTTLGPGIQNWLDDDEHRIRRRIAADMNRALRG